MSNFPPFRAAPPKSDKRPAEDDLKPVADELEKLLKTGNNVSAEDVDAFALSGQSTDISYVKAALDAEHMDMQHVEHVRCCAKCFSTEVVDAVKIGDAIYIKVS